MGESAEACARALVVAMGGEGWSAARDRVTVVIGLARRLDADREVLDRATEGERERVKAGHLAAWRVRLADLLDERPELDHPLREALAILDISTQHGTASDNSTVVQAGRDVFHDIRGERDVFINSPGNTARTAVGAGLGGLVGGSRRRGWRCGRGGFERFGWHCRDRWRSGVGQGVGGDRGGCLAHDPADPFVVDPVSAAAQRDDDPRSLVGAPVTGVDLADLGGQALIVERSSRSTLLVHLPRLEGWGETPPVRNGLSLGGYGAVAMNAALTVSMTKLPEQLRKTLTWDRGEGAVRARPVRSRHRHESVLRRPPLTVATADEREHERVAASVLPQGHRPFEVVRRRPRSRRPGPEQPAPQSPRLEDPRRGIQRTATVAPTARCCIDRLNSPNTPPYCSVPRSPVTASGRR
ncbi:hypothetical protein EDD40_0994 [Saccharothrix texasensis]|uniref:Uncharacterized protein n=1 Tax=Saccharothrix texasensis TaxID=103734 RepID=A0A3N1GZL1_9PSEU|nr:hypothetical protein EDD40_0994 [Saccharothrix texasensis]